MEARAAKQFIHAQWTGRALPAPVFTQHTVHYVLISYTELNINQTISDLGKN
jgi:hypothetical protein